MTQAPAVELVQATKVYKDLWGRPRVHALDGLTLTIERGEVLGLLGPNGAGKSTAIKLIAGLLFPSSGRVRVLGGDPGALAVRARTGYLPEETRLHKFLTARETLDLFGQLAGVPRRERKQRTEKLLDMVGLSHAATRRVGEMSKGMARRIGLAVALTGDPDLVILDEPTSGLDPIGAREVKDLIVALAARGKTVLLSSHLLQDVEDACSRIAMLYGGKLQALGNTQELLARQDRVRIELARPTDPLALARLEEIARGVSPGPVEIGAPKDRLEQFFLRLVSEAREKDQATAGARAGTGVAEFLRGAKAPRMEPVAAPATPLVLSSPAAERPGVSKDAAPAPAAASQVPLVVPIAAALPTLVPVAGSSEPTSLAPPPPPSQPPPASRGEGHGAPSQPPPASRGEGHGAPSRPQGPATEKVLARLLARPAPPEKKP